VPRLTGRGGPTVSPIGVGLAAVFAKKARCQGHRFRSVANPEGIGGNCEAMAGSEASPKRSVANPAGIGGKRSVANRTQLAGAVE
jgi:hypothetical protein